MIATILPLHLVGLNVKIFLVYTNYSFKSFIELKRRFLHFLNSIYTEDIIVKYLNCT